MLSTQAEVAKLQEELETMQPLLVQASLETEETMGKIAEDTVWLFVILLGLKLQGVN